MLPPKRNSRPKFNPQRGGGEPLVNFLSGLVLPPLEGFSRGRAGPVCVFTPLLQRAALLKPFRGVPHTGVGDAFAAREEKFGVAVSQGRRKSVTTAHIERL